MELIRFHRMLLTVLVAGLLGSPLALRGQVVVGTPPTASGEIFRTCIDGCGLSQSFKPGGLYLTSLSFWFHDGVIAGGEDFYNIFSISEISPPTPGTSSWSGRELYTEVLDDRGTAGRYDLSFDPIPMDPTSTYVFWVFVNNCGPYPADGCGAPFDPHADLPEGDFMVVQYPGVEVTPEDTYAGGHFFNDAIVFDFENGSFLPDEYGRDIRFEAVFHDRIAVPEPGSLLLLASGLLGIAGVSRRRGASREG